MSYLWLFAGGLGAAGALIWLNRKDKPSAPKGCSLTTEESIFLANQAFLSGNAQLVQATAQAFEDSGCHAEAKAMRDYLAENGINPAIPVVQVNFLMPQSVPAGHVLLQPGDTWRAAALLGGLGCAVGLSTLRDGIAKKGFGGVKVYDKNPWGAAWKVDDGFLECGRWIEATVVGHARTEKKPVQIVKLERISSVA